MNLDLLKLSILVCVYVCVCVYACVRACVCVCVCVCVFISTQREGFICLEQLKCQ